MESRKTVVPPPEARRWRWWWCGLCHCVSGCAAVLSPSLLILSTRPRSRLGLPFLTLSLVSLLAVAVGTSASEE